MLPRNHPDRIQITFDDRRLVANAGLILPATLALRLGLPELVQRRLDLGNAPGRANTGDKVNPGCICTGELCLKLSCSRVRRSSPHLLNLGRSTAIANCSAHLVQVSSSFAVIQRMATFSVIHPRPSEMFSTIPSTTNLFARSDDVAPSQWSLKRLV